MIPFTRLGLQQMQMLGVGAPTAGIPRFITDLFNLLQSSPTYTGGPLTATDYLGNLVTSPTGTPALEGGRLATTVAEGAQLGPELVVDGGFDSGEGWTLSAQATISDGALHLTSTDGSFQSATTSAAAATIGKRVYAVIVISRVGAGQAKVSWSGDASPTASQNIPALVGTHIVEWVNNSALTSNVTVGRVSGVTDIDIDNVSIREVIPTWLDTDIDGTPIQPSISIPTRSGTKKWYQEPFANPFGYSNWPARTNKVTCRKFNPVDLTNITKSGDAAAVLSVVDDTAALTAAGLIGVCTGGKVYKLDNSAGTATAFVNPAGACGTTNAHTVSIYARTTVNGAQLELLNGSGVSIDNSNLHKKYAITTAVPGSVNKTLQLVASAGQIIYFILPQLEEGAFATPPIFDPLNDSLTSITRAATNLTDPLTLAPQLQLVVIPATTGTAGTMLDDGTNKLSYNGTNLIFTDGVTTLSAAATLTAGTAYTIGVKGLAGDWALSLNTVDLDTDATGTVVAWATAKLGRNDADGDYFAGYFPNVAGYVGTDVNWYKTTLGA